MTVTAIGSLEPRRRATVAGRVRSVTSSERPYQRTDVELDDGSGVLVMRFIGRAHVPGVTKDRRLVADGTPGFERDALVMLNPLYSFPAE